MRRSVLSALLLLAASAVTAHAAIIPITTQGVIILQPEQGCSLFEADDGNTYTLTSQGIFTDGDRVQVSGTINTDILGTCSGVAGYQINVTSIGPAFAGIGTISISKTGPRLTTDDGRVFKLQNGGNSRLGGTMYVQGAVQLDERSIPTIINNTVGRAFSGLARIISLAPGNLLIRAEDGAYYSLDRRGSLGAFIQENDLIFVEGIRGTSANDITPLTSVTARPAFHASGNIIAQGAGVALDAQTLIFANPFITPAINAMPAGTKAYLRGRRTDDYDYGEVKTPNFIRRGVAGASYSTIGIIDTDTKTLLSLNDGKTIHLENVGSDVFTPDGSLAYVAGHIASEDAFSVTFLNNETRMGVMEEGTILNGYGCTPIIVFDTVGWVFPLNLGGYQVNQHVAVTGGINPDTPCLDAPGLIDNTIIETACPNCE